MKRNLKLGLLSLIVANSLFAYTDTQIDNMNINTYNDSVAYTDGKFANITTMIANVEINSNDLFTSLNARVDTMGTMAQLSNYTDTSVATGLQSSKIYADNLNNDTLLYINNVDGSTQDRITNVYSNLNTQINTQTSMISNVGNTTSFTKVSSVTGNEHGLYITDASTTISGGTTSSQMVLNDSGAKFSNVSNGSAIKISGIANAEGADEAVNLQQLQTYSTNTLLSANDYTDFVFSSVTGGGITENEVDKKDNVVLINAKTYADEGDGRTLKSANDYTDSKINSLEQSLTKEYRSATATAIALGVSPILANGNKNALGLGFGNYDGENAVAINYIAELDKNIHLQLGSSLSSANNGFKAGVSYGW